MANLVWHAKCLFWLTANPTHIRNGLHSFLFWVLSHTTMPSYKTKHILPTPWNCTTGRLGHFGLLSLLTVVFGFWDNSQKLYTSKAWLPAQTALVLPVHQEQLHIFHASLTHNRWCLHSVHSDIKTRGYTLNTGKCRQCDSTYVTQYFATGTMTANGNITVTQIGTIRHFDTL